VLHNLIHFRVHLPTFCRNLPPENTRRHNYRTKLRHILQDSNFQKYIVRGNPNPVDSLNNGSVKRLTMWSVSCTQHSEQWVSIKLRCFGRPQQGGFWGGGGFIWRKTEAATSLPLSHSGPCATASQTYFTIHMNTFQIMHDCVYKKKSVKLSEYYLLILSSHLRLRIKKKV
jgi:hypothetical protein